MRITPVNRAIIPPTQQADATLAQANPTSGTAYSVLATTRNCRLISIAVECEWTVQPSPLECHVTIDGQAYTFAVTDPLTATWYYALFIQEFAEANQYLSTTRNPANGFLMEGRNVTITAEITGGTVQALNARIRYAKW